MRRRKRQRGGYTLIIFIALIPLFWLVVLMTTAQMSQLSRQLKRTEQKAEQKTLRFSAQAWLQANRDYVRTLPPGHIITLPIDGAALHPSSCTAEVMASDDSGTRLTLTITLLTPKTEQTQIYAYCF